MAGLNKVSLIGSLGRDPEVKNLNNGGKLVNFSMATSESWRDKATGERKDRTEWHNIVIFNEKLADVAERFLKKGSKVYLEGALQTREYTDKDGNQRKSTEIVLQRYRGELTLLDSRKDSERTGEALARGKPQSSDSRQHDWPAPASNQSASAQRQRMADVIDDDIPF